ncbi:ESF1-like protein [Frankliniella fusca]|uniref:ESF1-like protein n=1 Tax=Frankliniella fusca TaxID=407009 RepID=A0AAE1H1P1_9NEOP|nr:ESF1-like protein [Frankliniella fusca]
MSVTSSNPKLDEKSYILEGQRGSLDGSPDSMEADTKQLVQSASDDEMARSGLMSASFNYINSIIGSGVIGIPYALHQAGFGLGLLLLILVAVVTDYSLILMVRSGHLSGAYSYQGITEAAFGRGGFILLSFLQFVYPFIAMVSYNVVVGDTVTKVFMRLFHLETTSIMAQRWMVIGLATIFLTIPLCLYRDIVKLAKISFLSLLFVCLILITIFIRLFTLRDSVPSTPDAYRFANWDIIPAIGIMSFAFMCHHNTFLIYGSIENASQKKWDRVTHASLSASFVVSAMFGIAGYATFTGLSQGDLLENYCWDDDLMNVSRLMFSGTILLTYPIECLVTREVVINTFFPRDKEPGNERAAWYRHVAITLAIVILTYFLSMSTDCLGVVLELNGVLAAVPLAFVLPAICYLKLEQGSIISKQKLPAVGLAVFGLIVAGVGLALLVMNFSDLDSCNHGKGNITMGDSIKDSRFSHIAKDPRFRSVPRSQRKVKIDKRFKAMFEDKRFKTKYTVDKRGRPIPKTSTEDLERFYDLSSGSSDSEDGHDIDNKTDVAPSRKNKNNSKILDASQQSKESDDRSSEDSDSTSVTVRDDEEGGKSDSEEEVRSDDEEILNDKIRSKLRDMSVDYARGEGAIVTDSSSDEDSSGDEVDENPEHGWGELDKDAERTDEITSRLAVCNMDWDRIRAVDLMVLLNSFTPPGGLIRSITIYPSEFGLTRMKKEEEEGPPELLKQSSKQLKSGESGVKDDDDDDDDDGDDDGSDDGGPVEENEEGSSYHMEKLRQYQLNRLKYFYAIVECDSPSTANNIYTECDGMEYESSATRLDLRFVPDDTTFEQDPRETCTGMPDAGKYRPRNFTTTALQQAKVELTWDETDPTRSEIANRLMAGDAVDDNDLQAYLASSSDEENSAGGHKENENHKNGNGSKSNSEESSDDEDPIAKYRSLLNGIEEEEKEKKNKDVHMEISWGLGLKERAEEAVKKKMASSQELTPFQQMMEKRKQKRLEKKKEKMQKKMQLSGENKDRELSSDDDIPSDIDMNDPYFAEEFKDMKKKPKKGKGKKKEQSGETEEEQQSKAELELLLLDKDEPKHFNFKKIQEEETGSKSKKKAKRRKGKDTSQTNAPEDDFKINVDDSRFSALYTSHLYNIDPTDPHFRKSNGMEALISSKQKRLADSSVTVMVLPVSDHIQSTPAKKSKKDLELSLLVKSVKNKTQNLKKQ